MPSRSEIDVSDSSEVLATDERASYVEDSFRQNVDQRVATSEETQSTPEAAQKTEKELTLEFLLEYYGDQEFAWGGHQGTIAYILDACPIGRMMHAKGPDAVIAWIDGYKVTPTEEVVEENKPELLSESDDGSKTDKAEDAKPAADSVKVEVSQPDAQKVVVVDTPKASVAKEAQEVSEVVVEPKEDATVPEAVITAAVDFVKKEHPEDVKGVKAEAGVASEDAAIDIKNAPVILEEPEGVTGAVITPVDVLKKEIELESESEAEAVVEAEDAESPETFELENSSTDIIEKIESWQALAEKETPLDLFLVTVIDELQDPEESTPDAGEILLNEVEEDELLEHVSAEHRILLMEVRSIKSSMDKLRQARTKQECDAYVDQTVTSLVELMRSMGYQNPEKMVRDFMYSNPFSTLEEIIDELERSIQRSIRYEAYRQLQRRPQSRHASFGRLVLTFLQALSTRNTSSDLAA